MDEFARAKALSDKRLSLPSVQRKREAREARLAAFMAVQKPDEKPVEKIVDPQPKVPSGSVRVEIRIYVDEEPVTLAYATNMRGSLMKSQLTTPYLKDRFRELLKVFGGVKDI